ncbi:MAG: high frequency lysogenization protein HflD [Arenicella sp.]|jgi:high frequency lysogenization protein|nr:high frequency lysogenization protein HflD [Arenicella sp.]
MTNLEERTLALAGVIQASLCVQSLARHGELDVADFNALMQSVLILDAASTASVYGGVNGVRRGLTSLADGLLVSPKADSLEVLRYAMSLLHLQRQLLTDEQKFKQFAQQIENLSGYSKDDLPAKCSTIYQDFISVMRPQIIVNGEEEFLQRPEVPVQIRTLLLSGIRSAVLWQQKGGGRFSLVWQRTRMQNAARTLLASGSVH